jgi:hypothetical protein
VYVNLEGAKAVNDLRYEDGPKGGRNVIIEERKESEEKEEIGVKLAGDL